HYLSVTRGFINITRSQIYTKSFRHRHGKSVPSQLVVSTATLHVRAQRVVLPYHSLRDCCKRLMKDSASPLTPVPVHESPALPTMPEWGAFQEAAERADRKGETLRILDGAGLSVDLSAQATSDELTEASQSLLRARNF